MTRQPERLALEEWLRQAHSAQTGCPPPEAYQRAAAAYLSSAECRRLDQHADRCPACDAERELARAFEAGPTATNREHEDYVISRLLESEPWQAERTQVHRGSPHRVPSVSVWKVAAAATLIAALAALVQYIHQSPPPLPSLQPDGTTRGAQITLLYPVGELHEMPQELRWEEVGGVDRYRLTLLRVDHSPLWEETVSRSPRQLPDSARRQLQAGVVYFWQVEAYDEQGRRLAWSEKARFLVTPPSKLPSSPRVSPSEKP